MPALSIRNIEKTTLKVIAYDKNKICPLVLVDCG